MKEFSVNKTSWHYRLNVQMAKTNERLIRDDYAEKFVQSKDNFCSYWRMTLWSMIKVAATVTFALSILIFLIYGLYGMGYVFLLHTKEALAVTGVVFSLIAIAVGTTYTINWADKRKKQKLDAILYDGETETSLAKAKYSSWKSGICLPVEFK